MAWRQHSQHVVLSQNTNAHPAFGNEFKIERNRKATSSIMKLNYGVWHIGQGIKPIETMNDPSQRPPAYIIARGREEMSNAGRSRGHIKKAHVGLVTWKNPYWRAQRPPVRSPIGPYQTLEKQSVLYRISTTFSKLGGQQQ